MAISTGVLFELSEQQFVSCVQDPDECGGTGGCAGATMELAFEYAMGNGLVTEWNTPYTSYNGADGACSLTTNAPVRAGGITGYEITVGSAIAPPPRLSISLFLSLPHSLTPSLTPFFFKNNLQKELWAGSGNSNKGCLRARA